MSEPYEYRDGDTTFIGYLAQPAAGGNGAGVLVLHEAPGLGAHASLRACMLAELGYVALAADLYGNGSLAANFDGALSLMTALQSNPVQHRRRVRHALETLADLPGVNPHRVAAIGYCSGGTSALELARSGAPVVGVVSFHGILHTPIEASPGSVDSHILVCTGSADPLVPQAQVLAFENEMTHAKADWQVIMYGGAPHGFTDRNASRVGKPGFGHDERADRRSWTAMQSFLSELLSPK
jgi:dienelactone hydrolase